MMRKSKQVYIIVVFLICFVAVANFVWYIFQEHELKVTTDHSRHTIVEHLTKRTFATKAFQFQNPTPYEENTTHTKDQKKYERIQTIINNPLLKGAIIGISLRDADTGELLYDHFGDIHLRPASNMKLLTAATALEVLGPEYEFSTEILTDGNIVNHNLTGNLYVKGGGDPTLLKADLDQFARQLREENINKVTGNLIGDDTWYDDIRYSRDLNWSDESNYTGAQISALTVSSNVNYHTGTVIVRVYPAEKLGGKPTVEVEPETDYLTFINDGETVEKDTNNTLTVEREHGTNAFIIAGEIPTNTVTEVWRSVWEPTEHVLHIFEQSLAEQDIQLAKNSQVFLGKTPKDATLLIKKQSMPLKDILIPFMKLSNNGHGEMLVKEIGKVVKGEGSWDAGLIAMEEALKELNVDTSRISFRDGSGMSHKNLIPPNELTHLLYEIQERDWFSHFENAQPVAGEADQMIGGTLSYRMTDEATKGKVKAKTGSLNGVSTLSGYLENQDGEKQIFSIMINNYIDGHMPSIQDAIVEELVKIR